MCPVADKIRIQLIRLIVMSLIISGNKIPGWGYTKKRSPGMSKWGKTSWILGYIAAFEYIVRCFEILIVLTTIWILGHANFALRAQEFLVYSHVIFLGIIV